MTENPYRDEIIGNLTAENFRLIDKLEKSEHDYTKLRKTIKKYNRRNFRLRNLHILTMENVCFVCQTDFPCSTIRILDGLHD